MEKGIPVVEFPLIVRGEGTLRTRERSIQIVSLVAERMKYRPDLPWEVHLRLASTAYVDIFDMSEFEDASIEGMTDNGDALSIPRFRWSTCTGQTLMGLASELSQGNIPLPTIPDLLHLTARLTDNDLALPLAAVLWPTRLGGLIARKRRPPTYLHSELGRIELWSGRARERVKIGGRNSHAERMETVMRIKLTKKKRALPLPTLLTRLQSELTDITQLFTFLSRRHVGCFFLHASVKWRDTETHFHEAEVWQSAPEPQADRGVGPIVNAHRMPQGALDALYQAFRGSPYKELIGRVAMYLAQAFNERQLELQILYAFTAFEGIINALESYSRSQVMEDAAFRRFRRTLERELKQRSPEFELNSNQVKDIKKKLGELQRRPVLVRAVEVVSALNVRWDDLWPGVPNLESALRAGYSRRSQFIHAGHILDPAVSIRDAIRFACLTERIIYALLNGEDGWLSPSAYMRWQGMPHDVPGY